MFCQEVFQLCDTWDKTIIFSLIHGYTVFTPAPIELKEKENHFKTKMSNEHSAVWKKNGLCTILNHPQQSVSHKYKCTCFIPSVTASCFSATSSSTPELQKHLHSSLLEQFPGTCLPQTNYISTKYQNMLSKFSTLNALYSIQKQIDV